jgi:hypothetical protein
MARLSTDLTLFFDRDLVPPTIFSFRMASSPHSSTSLQRRLLDSAGDVQMASFLLAHDGQRPLRTRPRRLLILLFAAAVATLLLLSQRPLLSGYVQPYRASPSSRPAISQNVVTPTVAIEHAVEPVVFALIMHSEVSAKEGAILLKVRSLAWIDIEPKY